ncbi:MAG: hypothetical protein GX849_03360 [Clostridiaceae bacterium]|jgi:hypothetical protein|nr:hypothetical protein [Clostridiaceae bacterium]
MNNGAKKIRTELPYLNNLPMALLVAAINLALAFVFQYGRLLATADLLIDVASCGLVTAFTSLGYARWAVDKRRRQGALPGQVPISTFMQRLPRAYIPLSILTGLASSALMVLVTWALLRFYPETAYTFPRFLVWKIGYATWLAAKVIEFGIFRYVQPDCVKADDPPQQGQQTVKNPLLRKEMFTRLYASVTTDFGMNMLIGLALGGTQIQGDLVLLMGVSQEGVLITGLVLGLIISILMIRPTLASVQQIAYAGDLPQATSRNLWAFLPSSPWALTGIFLLPAMVLSALTFWAVMYFFGFDSLNFFQFFIIRTAYTKLLSRLVETLAIQRYRQLSLSKRQPREEKVESHV